MSDDLRERLAALGHKGGWAPGGCSQEVTDRDGTRVIVWADCSNADAHRLFAETLLSANVTIASPEPELRETVKSAARSMDEWLSAGWTDQEHRKAIRSWLTALRSALLATYAASPEPAAALDVDTLVVGISEAVKRLCLAHGIRPTEFLDVIRAEYAALAPIPAAPSEPGP